MSLAAPLITRGMGAESRMVTQGYGGIVQQVAAAVTAVAKQAVIRGKGALEQIPEILYIVKASLIAINGEELVRPLSGTRRKIIDSSEQEPTINAQLKSEEVKRALKEILIRVKPLVSSRILDGKKRE
tara:strand:+ start:572 stop:955 length:384 start_codon:yes stop_codon:yes gene_type:complete